MKIEISEEGIIFCDGLTCDPFELYRTNAHCGNCPIIKRVGLFAEDVIIEGLPI